MLHRPHHKRAVQPVFQHAFCQIPRVASFHCQVHHLVLLHIVLQQLRQPRRRRGVKRADPQHPLDIVMVGHRLPRFLHQRVDLLRIGKKFLPLARETDAMVVPVHQLHSQLLLEQPHPGSDIGLHRGQAPRRLGEAAGPRYRREQGQIM